MAWRLKVYIYTKSWTLQYNSKAEPKGRIRIKTPTMASQSNITLYTTVKAEVLEVYMDLL